MLCAIVWKSTFWAYAENNSVIGIVSLTLSGVFSFKLCFMPIVKKRLEKSVTFLFFDSPEFDV